MFMYHYVYYLEPFIGSILYFWRLEFSRELTFTEMCELFIGKKMEYLFSCWV